MVVTRGRKGELESLGVLVFPLSWSPLSVFGASELILSLFDDSFIRSNPE